MEPFRTFSAPVRTFLDRPLHAVLATYAADGSVSQSVVWFLRQEDTIMLSVAPGSVKARHARHDPRFSLLALAPHGGAYVRIEGEATAHEIVDDALRLKLISIYVGADAHGWIAEHPLAQPNTLLRLHPHRVVTAGL